MRYLNLILKGCGATKQDLELDLLLFIKVFLIYYLHMSYRFHANKIRANRERAKQD